MPAFAICVVQATRSAAADAVDELSLNCPECGMHTCCIRAPRPLIKAILFERDGENGFIFLFAGAPPDTARAVSALAMLDANRARFKALKPPLRPPVPY